MTDASNMTVTIDDAIRARPDLLAQVEEAQQYFDGEYADLPPNSEWTNPQIRWQYLPATEEVRTSFTETHPEQEDRTAHSVAIPVRYLADDFGRGSHVRALLRQVTRARSKVHSRRIDRLLLQMEEQENG